MAEEAHRRYAEIMKDIEDMIDDHSECYASSLECSLHLSILSFRSSPQRSRTSKG